MYSCRDKLEGQCPGYRRILADCEAAADNLTSRQMELGIWRKYGKRVSYKVIRKLVHCPKG